MLAQYLRDVPGTPPNVRQRLYRLTNGEGLVVSVLTWDGHTETVVFRADTEGRPIVSHSLLVGCEGIDPNDGIAVNVSDAEALALLGHSLIKDEASLMETVSIQQRAELCAAVVTLDGQPAKISGPTQDRATITQRAKVTQQPGRSITTSWRTVERVVHRAGGIFLAYLDGDL